MILEVKGLFAGKWLKYKYKINPVKLKEKLEEEGDLFGYATVEGYIENNNYEDNLEILKRFPDSIEPVEGGRLDVLLRTNPKVLAELEDYRLEYDNLTVLERLIKILEAIDNYPKIKEYVTMTVSLQTVGDALKILKQERL